MKYTVSLEDPIPSPFALIDFPAFASIDFPAEVTPGDVVRLGLASYAVARVTSAMLQESADYEYASIENSLTLRAVRFEPLACQGSPRVVSQPDFTRIPLFYYFEETQINQPHWTSPETYDYKTGTVFTINESGRLKRVKIVRTIWDISLAMNGHGTVIGIHLRLQKPALPRISSANAGMDGSSITTSSPASSNGSLEDVGYSTPPSRHPWSEDYQSTPALPTGPAASGWPGHYG